MIKDQKAKNLPNLKSSKESYGILNIWKYIKDQDKFIFLMILFGGILKLLSVFIPLFQKYALDYFVQGNTLNTLFPFIMCYIVLIIISGIMNFLTTKVSFEAEMLIKRDLRNKAFHHIQTLSFSYFSKNSVGYIHSRLMSDITNIAYFLSVHGPYTIIDFIYLLGAIVVMLTINVKLTLMLVAVLPVLAFIFYFFQRKMVKVKRTIRESNSKITNDFNESITGGKTVKTLAIEDKMVSSFKDDTLIMKNRSVKYARISGIFKGIMGFGSSLCIAIVLYQGGIIAESEVGTFSLFMSYAQGMIEPLKWIMENISGFITTKVNIERYVKLMEERPDVEDSPEVIEKYGDSFNAKKENWEDIKGDIELKDVTFKYPDGEETVLENFSLKIPYGTKIAIVGETGAGKSTLVNLICRFYNPTKGQVLIDGRDVNERSQLWLHSSIGYVLQTPQLFSGTIADNLKFGRENATEEEMMVALKRVSAQEIVKKLEKGLYSDVGEGGELLSQGERQLISFARALIVDPKLIVLDEATSSVDSLTERKMQNAIDEVTKNRTSIIIAHRLSTVVNADIILVVFKGKIVESGSHQELLDKKGYYYDLYVEQFEKEATDLILS